MSSAVGRFCTGHFLSSFCAVVGHHLLELLEVDVASAHAGPINATCLLVTLTAYNYDQHGANLFQSALENGLSLKKYIKVFFNVEKKIIAFILNQ